MEKHNRKNKLDWNINDGDYELNPESRRSYEEKINRRKLLKKILIIALYFVILTLLSIWYFAY